MTDSQQIAPSTVRNHGLFFFCLVALAYFSELHGQREAKIFLGEIYIFCTAAFYLYQQKRATLQLKTNLPGLLIFAFFALSFLSILSTENLYWSYLGGVKWLCFLIAFLLPQIIQPKTDSIASYLWGPVIAAAIVSLFAILNFYGLHFDPVIDTLSGRGTVISTFGNPNYLSAFIGPTLPLCIYLLLQNRTRTKSILLFMIYSLILTALLYARTRGVIIGLACSFLLNLGLLAFSEGFKEQAAKHKAQIVKLTFLTIFLCLTFGGTPPFSPQKTDTIAERLTSASSLQARFMMWEITGEMIGQSPLTGLGLGAYGYSFPSYQGDFLAQEQNAHYREWSGWAHNAHNEYLQIAAETGTPNLLIFLAALCLYGVVIIRALKKEISTQIIVPLSSLAVLLTHSLVSFPLRLMPSAILFWLMLGLLTTKLSALTNQTYNLKVPLPGGVKILLITSAIVISVGSGAFFISDRYLGSGIRYGRENNQLAAKEKFETALALNPWSGRAMEQLGSTYTTLKKIPEGLDLLVKAQKYAISEILYVKFASNSLAQGKIEEAIAHYITGLYHYPNDYFMTMSLGIVAKMAADKYRRFGSDNDAAQYYKLALLQLESAKAKKTLEEAEENLLNSYIKGAAAGILHKTGAAELPPNSPPVVISATKLPLKDVFLEIKSRNGVIIRDFLYSPEATDDSALPPKAVLHKSIPLGDGWLREYSIPD